METIIEKEIQFFDDYEIVELVAELSVENDGIGGYEYWGCRGYDAGSDYLVVDKITWDRTLYSDWQNLVIERYITDNNKALEEIIIDSTEWEYEE